jgi:serine/threonine-protein kinase HipA
VDAKSVWGIDYLLVERYDRIRRQNQGGAASLERLHQEDFCQAQGIVPETKYQKEGGPSLRQFFCAAARSVHCACNRPVTPSRRRDL